MPVDRLEWLLLWTEYLTLSCADANWEGKSVNSVPKSEATSGKLRFCIDKQLKEI